MRVEVMSREQAKRYSFQSHSLQSAIISITDPDKPAVQFERNFHNGIKFVQRFSFWDEEEDAHGCITQQQAMFIANAAVSARIYDLLIVQCEAGVSRSAGVAAAILKALTGDDSQVFSNPRYVPNRKCYRLVLNAIMNILEHVG
jgi:predicted protein tyrosine phosphatase